MQRLFPWMIFSFLRMPKWRKYFTDAIRQDMVSNQNILHKRFMMKTARLLILQYHLMTAKLQALAIVISSWTEAEKKSGKIFLFWRICCKIKIISRQRMRREQMTKNKQQRSYISALAVLNQQFPDQTIYYVERINMLIICSQLERSP